jgi:hypothetical protein
LAAYEFGRSPEISGPRTLAKGGDPAVRGGSFILRK